MPITNCVEKPYIRKFYVIPYEKLKDLMQNKLEFKASKNQPCFNKMKYQF